MEKPVLQIVNVAIMHVLMVYAAILESPAQQITNAVQVVFVKAEIVVKAINIPALQTMIAVAPPVQTISVVRILMQAVV